MSEDSTVLLSRLAIEKGIVSQSQIDECQRLRKASADPLPIGELLLRMGYITGDQFKQLMLLQRQEAEAKGEAEEAGRFGRMIVARGFATPAQVQRCLRVQAQLAEEGVHKNLGQIMVEEGLITPAQVKSLLGDQDQVIALCPQCGEKYNVMRAWIGRSKCPGDGVVLAEADPHHSIGVIATVAAEEHPPDSPIGMEVGGCRILELLGKGAMAAVYKAKHLGLNRMVAVKMLPSVSKDPMMVKRLLVEARAIARLEHPNIVQVYDVGFYRGYFFMIMQLLKGETLTKRIQEWGGSLLEDQALAILSDVARGLEAAHGKGIIHRDVKPDNIILTEDGKAKIMDFGLAADAEGPDEMQGLIVGTPYYMSPEQWLGHKADERSDLYALGVILYFMVTGRRPFEGDQVDRLMQQHLKVVPKSPQSINRECPDGLAAIVKKLLAKAPAKRYQSATELLEDISTYQRGEDPKAMQHFGRLVRCGFCETVNSAHETKCKICGEGLRPVAGELSIQPLEDEFKCPGCAELVKKGSKSCPACKKPFCVRCGKRFAALRGHCDYCVSHLRRTR